MLDQTYSYSPYLDNDEESKSNYHYDPFAAKGTYLELPELPQAGRSKLLAVCADVTCVSFLWPGTEPFRGFNVMDIIEPIRQADEILTQMFIVQFGGDQDLQVIPVSVTQVITSCAGGLDNVFSQPEALPYFCARLFHCRLHVYSFI